jgi:PAS domain S-box-containing protein
MNAPTETGAAPEALASLFIVEDEALIAMELQDRLTSLGYSVSGTASRGEQALEAILASPPHLVLMDIHLAGRLNGIETAARLRARIDVPVIFLSAYSDAELLRQAGEVDPFGYLVKPFEERELHATIQMALYKHRMERALRESNARLDEKVRERTAQLAESRENLAVTLNSIGDAVLATDAQGRVTRLNPVAEQLTGWTQSEALGRPIADVFRIVNETTRKPAVIPVNDVLATGESHTLANHTALISRGGVELSIADSASPIRDAAGQIIGVVLVFRDETEARERRKLIARQGTLLGALRRVQEEFINSPEDSPPFDDILSVLLYSTSSDYGFIGEVLYTPEGKPYLRTQAMTDIAWDEATRRVFAERGPGGMEFSNLATLFGAVVSSGQSVIANEPAEDPRRGGLPSSHPALTAFMGAPISVGGRVVGMVGVANRPRGYDDRVLLEIQPLLATYGSLIVARRNALRRRAAEESLRELNADLEAEVQRRTAALLASEQRYSELVEHINDAIIRDDAEGRLVYANRRFLEWFGLEDRELHDIALEDYVAPEWRQIVRERHDRRVRGEQVPDRFEHEGLGPSGRRLWLDVFVTPVMEHGRIVGTQSVIRDVTERKKVDEALRRSFAMFETLATLSPVGIFRADGAGECQFVNRQWCEIAGISQTDAMGRGWMRTLHPEDRERILADWKAAIATGTGFKADYRFVRPDGQTTWVLGQAVATTDARGATTGYIGTLTDVTEQKQMESALRALSMELVALEGESFFQVMVQRLAALLDCEIALVGQIQPHGTAVLQTLALFEDGRLVENDGDGSAHPPCSEVMRGRRFVIASGLRQQYPHEEYFMSKQIEACAAVPLTDRAGHTVGCLGVMSRHPLSHPGRVEAILHVFGISAGAEIEQQRSARRFHDLFEFSPDAIVMTDRSGTIRLVNRKAETMFGWPREELIGHGIETLMPADDRAGDVLQRDRFVRSAAARPMGLGQSNLRAQRKNGMEFPVDISLGSIETAEGLMIAAAVRDITDRKNAERQASRTQRLESIGTLAGGIAHDLNNALTPILMMIDLLKEQYPAEAETLETVQRSANHAAQMVRHLLAFAKGTEGRRVSVQPRQLIEEMEKIVKGTFPKNIHVQVQMPQELPQVLGDATQLHQVLLNLCVNARDAMPDGGTLALEAEAEAEEANAELRSTNGERAQPRRYVVLRVTDTGGGIPPAILDRIFDPFFTTKGPEAGTGLGLFTVAGIVKGHGGFIRVDSRPPQGSTFSVYLPAEEGATELQVADTPSPGFLGNGETVLYVDDERDVRNAAEAVLKRLNFTPLLAEDGMSGLVKAVQQRDALRAVITDVHMPHMDGMAFVHALRRALPDVPVIVASGRLEGSLAGEFKKLGVNVTLDKPFTQEMLADALRAALTGS